MLQLQALRQILGIIPVMLSQKTITISMCKSNLAVLLLTTHTHNTQEQTQSNTREQALAHTQVHTHTHTPHQSDQNCCKLLFAANSVLITDPDPSSNSPILVPANDVTRTL